MVAGLVGECGGMLSRFGFSSTLDYFYVLSAMVFGSRSSERIYVGNQGSP